MPSEELESTLSVEVVRPIEEHAQLILEWRNNPTTLASSFHREPKTWDGFWQEFRETYFQNPDLPPVFILRRGSRVSFLRFKEIAHPQGKERRCCDISINVDPFYRGQGLGVASLQVAFDFVKTKGIQDVVAEIRVENAASVRAFERAGYVRFHKGIKHIPDTGEDCAIYSYLLTGIGG